MATGSFKRDRKDCNKKEHSSAQIEFRLIQKGQSCGADTASSVVRKENIHPQRSVDKEEMETNEAASLSSSLAAPSPVSSNARTKVKMKLKKLSLKQMFRGPLKSSAPGFEEHDEEAKYYDLSDDKISVLTFSSTDKSAGTHAISTASPASSLYNVQSDAKGKDEADISEKKTASFPQKASPPKKKEATYDQMYTFNDEQSRNIRKGTKKQAKNVSDQIPLQHSRALTALGSKGVGSFQPVYSPDEVPGSMKMSSHSRVDIEGNSEDLVLEENTHLQLNSRDSPIRSGYGKNCKDVMESVLVNTDKNEGKVLVLQVQDGEAVEAVSLGAAQKSTSKDTGGAYVSYTERLFQDDADANDSAEGVGYADHDADHDEKAKEPEENNDNSNETDQPDNVVGPLNAPLFMSSVGEMANLDDAAFQKTTSSASSVLESRDRYAPVRNEEKKVVRFSTASTTEKKLDRYSTVHTPSESKFDRTNAAFFTRLSADGDQSKSCITGPTSDEENDNRTEPKTTKESSKSDNVDKCPERCTESSNNEWAELQETMHKEIKLTKSSPWLLDGRDQSNVTSTSVASFDSGDSSYDPYDLDSIRSMATGASTAYETPLNITVSDELKGMAKELSRNPIVLMKWLNPS